MVAPFSVCLRVNSILRSETHLLPEVKEWCDGHISYQLTDVWRNYSWIDWAWPERYGDSATEKQVVWEFAFCFIVIYFTTTADWLAFKLRWLTQTKETG